MMRLKNQYNKNIKIKDVKNFLENKIYEDISKYKRKVKKKIHEDDFIIPQFRDYKNIVDLNYNVKQLKMMCKTYGIHKTGSKPQLKYRIFNYLKYSFYSIKIQKAFRGHMVKKINKLKGPALKNRKCVNENDFLMFEDMKEISYEQFFSYKDDDGFIYGFNICSLYNLIFVENNKNGNKVMNPYNRKEISNETIINIAHIIKLSKILNLNTEIQVKNDLDLLSFKKRVELKCVDIFQKFDELGHYTQADWFNNLSKPRLLKFINELKDVWEYRLNLTPHLKRNICPPNGKPFTSINIHQLFSPSNSLDKIKNGLLNVINDLVTKGIDRHHKGLGAYYVLGCLTLVSYNASTSLPWLYEAFMY